MSPHRWPSDSQWKRPDPTGPLEQYDVPAAVSTGASLTTKVLGEFLVSAKDDDLITPAMMDKLLDAPAASPPLGQSFSFESSDNLHTVAFVTVVVCLTLATLFLLMRLYTKAVLLRAMHWDDLFVFISWLCWIPYCALCVVVQPHAGIHIWNVSLRDVFFGVLYYADIIEILYCPTIAFVKLSILLQYRRIFMPDRRSTPFLWYGIWITFSANAVFYTCLCLLKIFQCQPREAIWNKLLPGSCFDVNSILISAAAFNLVSDVLLFALPQYSIWRLQMGRRRKIGLSAVFGVGGLACIVTALRVQTSVELIYTEDITWYLAPAAMWSVAEVCLAIIASCLPTLPKFWQQLSGRWCRIVASPDDSSWGCDNLSASHPVRTSQAAGLEKALSDGGLRATAQTSEVAWPLGAAITRPQHSALSDYWKTWYRDDDNESYTDGRTTIQARPPTPHPTAFHRTDPLPKLQADESGDVPLPAVQMESRPTEHPTLRRPRSHPVPLCRPSPPALETMPRPSRGSDEAPLPVAELWGHDFDPPRPKTCPAEDLSRWVEQHPIPVPPLPAAVRGHTRTRSFNSGPSPHTPWNRSPRHIAQCFKPAVR